MSFDPRAGILERGRARERLSVDQFWTIITRHDTDCLATLNDTIGSHNREHGRTVRIGGDLGLSTLR